MVLLSIGCIDSARLVHQHLDALHLEHSITAILDADAGRLTSSAVYEWAKHLPDVERIKWSGAPVAVGRRRGVILDRLGTLIAAAPAEARVLVWGPVPVFAEDRSRLRDLDMPPGVVIEAAINAGRSGWIAAGVHLVGLGRRRPDRAGFSPSGS